MIKACAQDSNFSRLTEDEVVRLSADSIRPIKWYYMPKSSAQSAYLYQLNARMSDWSGANFSNAELAYADFTLCRFGRDLMPSPWRRLGALA